MELRPYQREAVDAVWEHLRTRDDNPCIVLPTAAGKSHVISEICREAVETWGGRVLLLTHVRELVEQNAQKIIRCLGSDMVGVYSAGLRSRDTDHPIIAAGIQSVYKRACELGAFDLVLVDECFPAGTRIDGRPVEEIVPGEHVRSFNHDARRIEMRRVQAVSKRRSPDTMVRITLADGRQIVSTPNHPFFVGDRYVEARSLTASSLVYVPRMRGCHSPREGDPSPDMVAVSVSSIASERAEAAWVYNLQVEGNENYFAEDVLVHNCHLLPPDGEGMYKSYFADARIVNPQLRVIGLTATPFRTSSGEICSPDNILNHICYEAGVRELIAQGYLCPLKSKCGSVAIDTSTLHIRAGEFIADEAEALMNTDARVSEAVREIISLTNDRHACLLFATSVRHGEHIVRTFKEEHGIECGFVTGKTPIPTRDRIITRFRGERTDGIFTDPPLKYLCNVNVLTTGFDAPHIDCVAMLRPTMSPGLLIQMVGRGFRLHPSKQDCLILDYADNILRHGPVDQIHVGHRPKAGGGDAPAKTCPKCSAIIHAGYAICPECGFTFPKPEVKHGATANSAPVLSTEVSITDHAVTDIAYSVYKKKFAPDDHPRTMLVEYRITPEVWISEWVCPEHKGYARSKFESWWRKRTDHPYPSSAADAVRIAESGGLCPTLGLKLRYAAGDDFDTIVGYKLGDKPELKNTQESGDTEDLVGAMGIPLDEIPF